MPPRPKETDNEERDEKSNEEKTKRDERAGLPNSLKKQPNRGSYLSTSDLERIRDAREKNVVSVVFHVHDRAGR